MSHLIGRRRNLLTLISRCTLGLLLLSTPAVPALAQVRQPASDALKQLSLDELGDIEVTSASKIPDEAKRVAAAVFVITQEDIRRSGATSLPEVLRLAPGVDVARIDSDHWSVGVRGFGDQFSKSVLVLVDGRSVYTPLFAGVFWSVQDTLLEDIDRIEVIRGPGGTVWGANAVNGVINIITKHTKDTQGALASVGSGNIDQTIAAGRYGGGNGKDFTYRFYGKGFRRGPESHSDGQSFDEWKMGQAGFRSEWSAGRDHVTVQGDAYKGTDGQSISIGSYAPPSQTTVYGPLHVSGGNLLAQWHRDLSSGDVQIQAYYDHTYLLGPQIGETRHTFDFDFIHHVTALRRQNLVWGLGSRISPSDTLQTIQTLALVPQHQTNTIHSAFAQDDLTLVDKRLWLTLGSKLEHNEYTGFEVQPSARVLFTPTAQQSVWGAVTRAVRTPSLLEENLQLTDFLIPKPLEYLRIVGNPTFLPERLRSYEVGYRNAVASRLYVDLATFHNVYDDLESFGAPAIALEASPTPAHIVINVPYVNGVRGTSNGVELAANWKPASVWQLKGSYSYLQIVAKDIPGVPAANLGVSSVATYEGSSPRHQLFVQSLINLSSKWQVDQTYRYVTALPARQIDSYGSVSVRVGWIPSPHVALSVIGENLSNARHLEFAHDPGPAVALSRTVYAMITWKR